MKVKIFIVFLFLTHYMRGQGAYGWIGIVSPSGNVVPLPDGLPNQVPSTNGSQLLHWVTIPSYVKDSGWTLWGNSGTNATNFIGTTDNQPLKFKVNNNIAGFIDNSNNNNLFLGYSADSSWVSGFGLTLIGRSAGEKNTTGSENTHVGDKAGHDNGTGSFNNSLGAYSLFNSLSSYNTAIGTRACYSNTTGLYTTSLGDYALFSNQSGSSNIAIGSSAGYNATGDNNIFIGDSSGVSQTSGNNKVWIGNSLNSAKGYAYNHGNGLITYDTTRINGYSDSITLLGLGDSWIQSNTSSIKNSFIWKADSILNTMIPKVWTSYNLGISAQTSAQILLRVNTAINLNPQYIVVDGGINDIYILHLDSLTIVHNLQAMYDSLSAQGYVVIAMNIPPSSDYDANQNATRNKVNAWINGKPRGVSFVLNVSTYMANPSDTVDLLAAYDAGDHVHLNGAGTLNEAQLLVRTVTWTNPTKLYVSGTPYVSENCAPNKPFAALTYNGIPLGLGYNQVTSNVILGNTLATATGADNTGAGYIAMNGVTSGIGNTGLGAGALYTNSTANNNTAVGYGSLFDNNAANNTACGTYALNVSTGINNTALGDIAGSTNTTGTNNTFLGYNTQGGAALTNITVIGSGASAANGASTSNSMTYGNTSVTRQYMNGNVVIVGQNLYILDSTTPFHYWKAAMNSGTITWSDTGSTTLP